MSGPNASWKVGRRGVSQARAFLGKPCGQLLSLGRVGAVGAVSPSASQFAFSRAPALSLGNKRYYRT